MANVDVTINGREVSVEEGSTILEAAQKAGFHIPTLCHLKDCHRRAHVESASSKSMRTNLVPRVRSGTRRHGFPHAHAAVLEARTTIVQLLLANHPPECLTCVRNGDCELQSLAESLNIREIPYHGERRRAPVDLSSPSIERDPEKCILCGRCVRVCEEIQGVSAITFVNRGFKAEVAPAFGRELDLTSCTNCGQCIIHCPTGALRERSNVQKVWDFLHDPKMHVVVQTAPAVRVAIGEMFGMPVGTISTGQLASALSIPVSIVCSIQTRADLPSLKGDGAVERVKAAEHCDDHIVSPGW